jgi:transposase
VFADDTTLPVLDPGRGRTKTGRLWCYAVDDRPWAGPTHPVAAYVYAEDRKGTRPAGHLAAFRGVLQVDGYDGFKRLAVDRADSSVTLAAQVASWPGAQREYPQPGAVIPTIRRLCYCNRHARECA